MFWTDWGKIPKIEKIGMDGVGRKVIVRTGLKWPNGLALDLETETLYWGDAGTSQIESSTLEGRNRKVQLQSVTIFSTPVVHTLLLYSSSAVRYSYIQSLMYHAHYTYTLPNIKTEK